MPILSVTYASAPSADLLIPTLEFNNETAGVIRLHEVTEISICYNYLMAGKKLSSSFYTLLSKRMLGD
jgi:hypothetical protein